jgi:hypothetical protein
MISNCNSTIIINSLFAIIIIIFIYNIITLHNNNNNKNIKEDLIEDLNENVEKFINPLYDISTLLRNYSNYDKVVLNGKCKQEYYTSDILTEEQKSSIQKIVKFILSDISDKSTNNSCNINNNGIYNFKEINTVLIQQNLLGTRQVIDTFIYDIKNFHSVRIIVDVVTIGNDLYLNHIGLFEGSNYNILNRYDTIKNGTSILYSKDQFVTSGISMLNKTYNPNYALYGIDSSKLDRSNVNDYLSFKNVNKLGIDSFGKLLLPTYIDTDKTVKPQSSEFCKAQSVDWDWTSANKALNIPPNCQLHNSASFAQANTPFYTPSIFDHTSIYKNNSLDNAWLFYPERGNIPTPGIGKIG